MIFVNYFVKQIILSSDCTKVTEIIRFGVDRTHNLILSIETKTPFMMLFN